MKNPFKKIFNHEVPEVLKEKVMDDINIIMLSIDIADLFVVKCPNAVADLLTGGGDPLDKENKKQQE